MASSRVLICIVFGLALSGSPVRGEDGPAGDPGPFGVASAIGLVVEESGEGGCVVASVRDGSPAERAGLLPGDRIRSLGGKAPGGAFEAAVSAIFDATRETGEDAARLVLRVKRGEREVTIDFRVSLREIDVMVVAMRGLDFLAGGLARDPGYEENPQKSFYAPIIYAPLAGSAFLAGGSTRVEGRHAAAIRRVLAYVMKHGGRRKENQDEINKAVGGNICSLTHNSGFSAMFLAQLLDSEFPEKRGRRRATPRRGNVELTFSEDQIREKLAECCRTLEKLALPNGGWQHGSGGPNMLGYTHLTAATVTALNGLCMAGQVGVKVDRRIVEKGFDYIREATSNGEVGYAVGNRGSFSAGRNAAALQCFIRGGRAKDRLVAPVSAKLLSHLEKAATGHGSPTWHMFYASLATDYLGRTGDGAGRFFELYGKRLLANQRENGSIQALDLPGTAPGSGEENRLWGALYTTPLIVMALLAPYRRGLLLYDFGKGDHR